MKISEIKNIDSWVMRITRNQCYDWVKVNRFNLQTDKDIHRDDLAQQATLETDEDTVIKDQLNWLSQVVDSLSPKQKEIYHLREVEELTYQDIAEILSLTLSDVKVTMLRTREKIRKTIEKIDSYGLAN